MVVNEKNVRVAKDLLVIENAMGNFDPLIVFLHFVLRDIMAKIIANFISRIILKYNKLVGFPFRGAIKV